MPEREQDELLRARHVVETGALLPGAVLTFNTAETPGAASKIISMVNVSVTRPSFDLPYKDSVCTADMIPDHKGVPSFSCTHVHECTVPLNYQIKPPLPAPVCSLANTLHQVLRGNVAVAGGAALAQYIRNLPGCKNCFHRRFSKAVSELNSLNERSDVDIFVPADPAYLIRLQASGLDHPVLDGTYEPQAFLSHYLPQLRLHLMHHGFIGAVYGPIKVKRTARDTNAREVRRISALPRSEEALDSFAGAPFITGKVEFDLRYQALTTKIQLILVDTHLFSLRQSFGDYILGYFDASAARCSLHLPCEDVFNPKVSFHSKEDEAHTLQGKLYYTVRPWATQAMTLRRIKKYCRRGYTLSHFEIDPMTPRLVRKYMLMDLQRFYLKEFVGQIMDKCFGKDHIIDVDIYAFLIGEFLGPIGTICDKDVAKYAQAQRFVQQWPHSHYWS
jgi:hypothetical protein